MPLCFAGQLACLVIASACFLPPVASSPANFGDFHGVNPGFIDAKASPTKDFYRYSNGGWLDRTAIPADQGDISGSSQARQRNEELMWKLVAAAATNYSVAQGTPEQLVGQFLLTGLDETRANQLRYEPIKDELQRIGKIQTRGDVMAELGRLHRLSISVGFESHVGFDYYNSSRRILHIWQGGLSLRGRDQYLNDDSKARNLRNRLTSCIQRTLILVGEDPGTVVRSAQRIMAIETRIAGAWKPGADTNGIEQNFHYKTINQLTSSASNIAWDRYFDGLGLKHAQVIDVAQPEYLASFGDLLSHVKVRDWQTYLRWHFVAACSPYLSSEFVQQSFELDAALTGQEALRSRRETVLETIDTCLGNELGQMLAKTEFAMNSKPKVLTMVQNIRSVLRGTIEGLEWMAPSTKAKALEKLDRMRVNVCYPDQWRDSSKLEIKDDSYVQNVLRAREFDFQQKLDSLSQPIDRTEWDVRAYAVDAHYNPSLNAIILPAGVLQPPYFDIKADDASNYGSFGTVIGHEMMHAFDGRGRKFDADGNLKNWWTEADGVRYDQHQKPFVEQYDQYPVLDKLNVNGKLTLEENVADLGGVMASYAAYEKSRPANGVRSSDGFTGEQRFFISFAQLFRTKSRPEIERFEQEADPHSPPKYRVQGVLQNVPEFWKAFKADPPKLQLRIW